MSRPLRFALTLVTTVVFTAFTALPALAAAGTKPDPTKDPFLVGSLAEIGTAAILGVLFGFLAIALRAPGPDGDDHH